MMTMSPGLALWAAAPLTAVGDVVDRDLLVFPDPGDFEQVAVDGAGTFVFQFRVGYPGAMELGLEHGGEHGGALPS